MVIARPLLVKAINSLEHAHETLSRQPEAAPNVALADGLIVPALAQLRTVLGRLDAHHDEVADLVRTAIAARDGARDELTAARATLQRVMQILGPDPADDRDPRTDIARALDALREAGITYQDPDA